MKKYAPTGTADPVSAESDPCAKRDLFIRRVAAPIRFSADSANPPAIHSSVIRRSHKTGDSVLVSRNCLPLLLSKREVFRFMAEVTYSDHVLPVIGQRRRRICLKSNPLRCIIKWFNELYVSDVSTLLTTMDLSILSASFKRTRGVRHHKRMVRVRRRRHIRCCH